MSHSPRSPNDPANSEVDVLERNVDSLLTNAGDPPRISDAARQRIRAQLLATAAETAKAPPRRWGRALAFGGAAALAMASAAAIVVLRDAPRAKVEHAAGAHELPDGSLAEVSPSGHVEVLGPRRVRVRGAAIFDVVPGKERFIVETERGTVEALGTRFLVEASADRTTAAVIRGQVALRGRDVSGGGSMVLGAGEGGQVERDKAPARHAVPRLSHLTSWAKALREERGDAPSGARRGTLFARNPNFPDGMESPLPMKQLTVDVVVDHRVARVAIDHTFHNAADATLEGMYRFSLPPDAALQRLAMYVGEELMESAVVERMRARRVYEDLVLRRVDPALLEYTGVGKVQLRVYPLPPRSDKRLALAYTQSLPQLYDTWSLAVPLPKIDTPVDDVRFAIRIADCANCEVASPSHQVSVARRGDDLEVSYQARGEAVGDSLLLNVRDTRDKASVARHRDGADEVWLVRAPGALPAQARPQGAARRHWVILQDASASRGALERRAQAELVDALARELDEDDQVALVAFDVAPRTLLPFSRVMDLAPRALEKLMREDDGGVGATDLGRALDAATAALRQANATNPMIIYVGDGIVTAGDRKLDALRARVAGKATFVGLGVGDGTDTLVLGGLAAATGGLVASFDLSEDLRWRAFDLVATLRTARATGLVAKLVDKSGQTIDGAMLRSPQLADGEELEVVAKVPATAEVAALEVTGEVGGEPWRQRIELSGVVAGQRDTGFAPRLWAQREIDRLLLAKHEPVPAAECTTASCPSEAELREARDESLRKQIVELGKRYFLLSRHTSLIVLENDAMYAQYGVTKGQGKTWAPYAMPARLPAKVATPAPTAPVAPAAPPRGELTRAMWQPFAELPSLFDEADAGVPDLPMLTGAVEYRRRAFDDVGYGTIGGGRYGTIGAGTAGWVDEDLDANDAEESAKNKTAESADKNDAFAPAMDLKVADVTGGFGFGRASASIAPAAEAPMRRSRGVGWGYIGLGGGPGHGLWSPRMPGTPVLADLSALVPALAQDELARARRALRTLAPVVASDADAARDVDAAAAEALRSARAALPAGTYRWGALEIVVDAQRHLGWRRVLPSGLVEAAGFDGARLERRYAELDLAIGGPLLKGDEVALQATMFPLWFAPVESYARRFIIARRADGAITLTPRPEPGTSAGAAALIFELEASRLRRITDGYGHVLAEVTWRGDRPATATLRGRSIDVRYEAIPAHDAATSLLGQAPSVQLDAPVRHPALAAEKLAQTAPGSDAWRAAMRQLLASRAIAGEPAELGKLARELAARGPLSAGELVLASSGLTTLSSEEQARLAAGPHPVMQYLASPSLRRKGKWTDVPALPGALGAMVGYLQASDLLFANKLDAAIDLANRLPAEATLWRALITNEIAARLPGSKIAPERLEPLLLSQGPLTVNHARLRLAELSLASRAAAERERGVDKIASLLATMDLAAAPPSVPTSLWYALSSVRGEAFAEATFAKWRDRVMAQGDFAHVMSYAILLPYNRERELLPALSRALELAKGDVHLASLVAGVALMRGQAAWAWLRFSPLLDAPAPARVDRLAEQLAAGTNNTEEAMRLLERAMRTESAGKSSVDARTARSDYARLLQYASQLASGVWSGGKGATLAKARELAAQWRSLDPDGPVDRALAEVYLAASQMDEAVRLLSSGIDRDPMSGAAWGAVAEQLQRAGKLEQSLAYWHEAVILDQTNPTWRLREARALMALGRKDQAKAIAAEVARRKWNVHWEWETYEARELLRELSRR